MSKLANHAILDALSKTQLVELARRHGIALAISQSKMAIVGSLAGLTHNEFRQLLQSLSSSELRAICRMHGLPSHEEASKADLVDLILGPPPTYLGLVNNEKKSFMQDGDSVYKLGQATPNVTPSQRPSYLVDEFKDDFLNRFWLVLEKNQNDVPSPVYRSFVLGLIFLKYVCEQFNQQRKQLLANTTHSEQTEDPQLYQAVGGFWVPKLARWSNILAHAQSEQLPAYLASVADALEISNPLLTHFFPESFRKCPIDHVHLSELIEVITTLGFLQPGAAPKQIFGRIFTDVVARFAQSEREGASNWYTPASVTRLMVEMLAPHSGTIYDPACGSGGLLIQAAESSTDEPHKLSLIGQDSDLQAWQMARMNLLIHGLAGNFGVAPSNALDHDRGFSLRANFIVTHPPSTHPNHNNLNPPPLGSTNNVHGGFAWISHVLHHLANNGLAVLLLADDMASNSSVGARKMRKALVLDDVIDCIVALPHHSLFSANVPLSLWIVASNKQDPSYRNRRGRVLMIDARQLGSAVDRHHRELTHANIVQLAAIYHAWRGDIHHETYFDLPKLCRSVTIDEIGNQGFVLHPSLFLGSETDKQAPVPSFADAFPLLAARLEQQFTQAQELEQRIRSTLARFKI